ncbi:MAG: hypothetical protein M3Z27_02210 [Actinomycetota bacterium]|nr:hypothetical protein [Actinomycetota bacterium]
MLGAPYVAVAGTGTAAEQELRTAEAVGEGLATGLGELRNGLLVRGAIDGVQQVASPGEAVAAALRASPGRDSG